MISDPWFYAAAIPAIILTGLAKGGFLGAAGGLAVPLMSLTIPPVQAAGIMLPILNIMDLVGLFAYRRDFHWANLAILLPAAIAGVALGWATAAYVTEGHVRLIIGIIGAAFTINYWRSGGEKRAPQQPDRLRGTFWGMVAGFTSFVSHTGAPPFNVYMLPQRLPSTALAATAVVFFTTINLVKLIPYYALGQFNTANLKTTVVLLPLAPLALLAGVWLTRRINQGPFYRIAYASLFVISLKLIFDGIHAIWFAG
ncbi:MAG: sulfite exporter TauE/SafE family protein [Hyphomicrobiaceae bacterium]|nr:sulfite exporter TauE/SafE family protein [Hyphomicrobiaceae bacterium]